MSKVVRVSITMPSDLKDWYQEKAEVSCLSMSTLMMISLEKVREQTIVTDNMPDIMMRLKDMEKED